MSNLFWFRWSKERPGLTWVATGQRGGYDWGDTLWQRSKVRVFGALFLWFLVVFFLCWAIAGCGQTTMRVSLAPEVNSCQVTETRTVMSTSTVTVCWDEDGRALGAVGGAGVALIQIPMEAVQVGGIVGAAGIVGSALKNGIGQSVNITGP